MRAETVVSSWPLLNSARKVDGKGLHRVETVNTTLKKITPYLRSVGITRLADITGLDRVGIPVYSAIMPRSRDILSVYNGKGIDAESAKAGAIMEGLERYVASRDHVPVAVASYSEISRSENVLDPREINIALQPTYTDSMDIAWMQGFDLVTSQSVLIPHFLTCYFAYEYPWPSCYQVASTNGLASGNSVEEATCHALAEVIERDALTMADVIDRRLEMLATSRYVPGGRIAAFRSLKEQEHPTVDLETLPLPASQLAEAFQRVGLCPHLRQITSDIGIPTFLCAIQEDIDPEFSQGHMGTGTDPDPLIAIIRALTEAAQSRAVDIQALREDIRPAGAVVDNHMLHTQRTIGLARNDWFYRQTETELPFNDLRRMANADILDDIGMMVDQITSAGLKRVIMIDLSIPELPVSVVRVVVPGLESWSVDRSRLGGRVRDAWKTHARTLR